MDWRSFVNLPVEKRLAFAGVTAAFVALGAIAVLIASSGSATSTADAAAQGIALSAVAYQVRLARMPSITN